MFYPTLKTGILNETTRGSKLFQDAIRATAQRMEIREIYIEKDYWVCLALHQIFHSPLKEVVIFKGGTALSKCHGVIERFSEDIDLVVLTDEGQSGNQKRKRLKDVTGSLEEPFEEVELEGVTNKMGQIRKLAFEYPKLYKGDFGQVRDKVIVEASLFGSSEPRSKMQIFSYIYKMMMDADQAELAEQYNLLPFEVSVLDYRRTFCEKIMSLVRFSHSEDPITDLRMKIRHYYDLHLLLTVKEIREFLASQDFEDMMLTVAKDDVAGYINDNKWLEIPPKESIVFKDVLGTWKQLEKTYTDDFSGLVYGELPEPKRITESIKKIAERLKQIKWTIKIDEDEV